jgi:hypothetical protein
VDFLGTVSVNENMRLIVNIDNLRIAIKGIIDSRRGNISVWRMNLAF